MLYDYSYRLDDGSADSTINIIARYYLEIGCYIFFSLENIFGIIAMGAFFGKESYFSDRWRSIYFVVLIISWTTYISDNYLMKICMCIRLLGPIRILNLFEPLKKNLNSFIIALTAVYKVFLTIFGLMFFYALVGMYLFYGLEENRCRTTEVPINNVWLVEADSMYFCGNTHCQTGFIYI